MLLLIFPHQLYWSNQKPSHLGLEHEPSDVLFVEDSLFFGDHHYPADFHKQKLWFHRATMRRYAAALEALSERKSKNSKKTSKQPRVHYAEYEEGAGSLHEHIHSFFASADSEVERKILVADPTDFILSKRLTAIASELELELEVLPSQLFLNSPDENQDYREGKKKWFMADFYKWQRTRMELLVEDGEPVGGKWSFDEENRKKVPKSKLKSLPSLVECSRDEFDEEAKEYVEKRFPESLGSLDEFYYPTSAPEAERWLDDFLEHKFEAFGPYEDAIEQGESWLWHSVLTPALNTGLLSPQYVTQKTIDAAEDRDVPLNSLEGFLRQIVGWREFMRATYEDLGVTMRTTNYWSHTRAMPSSFYDGSTGIIPVDDVIKRLLATGYCHHIERLMVLGGFMFLCEIDPQEIYRWFMEMFIDSYDWVMVPNVYAMSQNADGGLITTKPYFSGSAYVRKMSHYPKGDWCDVWDGLYWRWIWNHVEELGKNPRWAMMCATAKRMDEEKRNTHLKNANDFLSSL